MYKQHDLVMLPTNEKATVGSIVTRPSDSKMAIVNVLTKDDPQPCVHQHLYIISDEEIKEGDWVYNTVTDDLIQVHLITDKMSDYEGIKMLVVKGQHFHHHYSNCKKIIATTDKSLTINITRILGVTRELPQIPQSFIEYFVSEYNKGNIISKVMVECEEILGDEGIIKVAFNEPDFKLKINPKDNTIIIRKVKDNWNREEVIELFKKYQYDYAQWVLRMEHDINGKPIPIEWIKENL